MQLFQCATHSVDEYSEEDEEEEEENQAFEKIEVSDSETDIDDETVKIINVHNSIIESELGEEEENSEINEIALDELNEYEMEDIYEAPTNVQVDNTIFLVKKVEDTESLEESDCNDKWDATKKNDYKRMDVSVLRTMVISRGLVTDTKKMKKQDLVRLLEEHDE